MTVAVFLRQAAAQFTAAGIATARLDAQVLLQYALGRNKAWLLAHGDAQIPPTAVTKLNAQATRRAAREPLAYIVGHQEFYGRDFAVTPDVLIPRPETETLIDELKALPLAAGAHVLDVGTGSGAIGITATLELPRAHVTATDVSSAALAIAEQNAAQLGAQLQFGQSDLLANIAGRYNVIIANLPYVATNWPRSPETNFEPRLALFAKNEGLALITTLLAQAPAYLKRGGYALLEADPRQFTAITKLAQPAYRLLRATGFTLVLQKI